PLIPLPVHTEVWMRKPFAIKLSAGPGLTDMVFVPVHLTARIEMYFFEDATAHREEEARVLAKRLGGLREQFHDDDVVVLGDFNIELPTEHVSDPLEKAGWRDLDCADLPTFEWGTALDRFFVPRDQPEFALDPNFARVVPAGVNSWSEMVERYSDHVIVVAEVLAARDGD